MWLEEASAMYLFSGSPDIWDLVSLCHEPAE